MNLVQAYAGMKTSYDNIVPYTVSGLQYFYFYDSSAGNAEHKEITSNGVVTLKGTASGLKTTWVHFDSIETAKIVMFDRSTKAYQYWNISSSKLGTLIKSGKFAYNFTAQA